LCERNPRLCPFPRRLWHHGRRVRSFNPDADRQSPDHSGSPARSAGRKLLGDVDEISHRPFVQVWIHRRRGFSFFQDRSQRGRGGAGDRRLLQHLSIITLGRRTARDPHREETSEPRAYRTESKLCRYRSLRRDRPRECAPPGKERARNLGTAAPDLDPAPPQLRPFPSAHRRDQLLGRRLSRRRPLLNDVIVDRVHGSECFRRYFGIWNADAERFFHAHYEFERVDRIKAEAAGTEERQIIADFLGGGLQHQILHKHFLDALAQVGFRHGNGRTRAATVSQWSGDVKSGERTRLACWRSRPRDRELFRTREDVSARAPKPAREARALPRSDPISPIGIRRGSLLWLSRGWL